MRGPVARPRQQLESPCLCQAPACKSLITCLIRRGQEQAQQLDTDLMSDSLGFSVEQLMELAGLSGECPR